MSSNLNYKQTSNVERRTWNVDEYEQRAKARAAAAVASSSSGSARAGSKRPHSSIVPSSSNQDKEEFRPAAPGAAGPERSKRAFLKARRDKVDIDSKIGSTEIVSAEAAATIRTKVLDDDVGGGTTGSIKDGVTKTGVGWHCKVCDCFLKDSHTYLDHINGKKHQRNLGYSMRVEKSTKDQVRERLAQLAKEKEALTNKKNEEEPTNFEDIIKAKDEEANKRKEERARKREERKKRMQQEQEEEAEDDEEEEAVHPDMAAMMGFAGFGGGNKTR